MPNINIPWKFTSCVAAVHPISGGKAPGNAPTNTEKALIFFKGV